MHIIHERDKCIGCGSCAALCPKFWEMGTDGRSDVKGQVKNEKTGNYELEVKDASAADVKCNEEAAYSCPVQIIHIEK